jgi:amino acid adenylation domain-containing protein
MERLHPGWVSLQAERRPEAPAVVLRHACITYGELDALSTRLARSLKSAGSRRGDRVCLLMPKSPLAIACLLGIYKADCIYVPLDPASPAARLQRIVGACEPRWLIAAGQTGGRLQELAGIGEWSLGWMDPADPAEEGVRTAFNLDDVLHCSAQPVAQHNSASDPAHILFTSGSTGTPKGVVISHANVAAFIEWAVPYFGLDATDRMSGHAPLHFDLSMFDIFGAFAAGAELHLVPAECHLLPNKQAQWIRDSRLTHWFSVPSALNYMAKFDVVARGDYPELRRVVWCGEVLPTPVLLHWMERLPHAQFTNLYGPTETTIASSYHTLECPPVEATAAIPIGRACGGEELLVLDEGLKPVSPGEIGDLYIGGEGLSSGYWRDAEATARAFVAYRSGDSIERRIYRTGDLARLGEDGLVYFAGRKDQQVKSRGYRIELGEIETALNTMHELRECAVVAVGSEGFEGVKICCAYVPRNGTELTPLRLRSELGALLPDYMIPSEWKALSELPKNATGKIDRRSLSESWR